MVISVQNTLTYIAISPFNFYLHLDIGEVSLQAFQEFKMSIATRPPLLCPTLHWESQTQDARPRQRTGTCFCQALLHNNQSRTGPLFHNGPRSSHVGRRVVRIYKQNSLIETHFTNKVRILFRESWRTLASSSLKQDRTSYPIQWRILALGENSFALPPNRFKVGPHGHSL